MAERPPIRRLELRRSKDCEAHGTLVPGLSRVGIRRTGAPACCNETARTGFKRVTLRRAGQTHTCGACAEFTFSNGPYTAPVFGPPGTRYTIVDLASLDLSAFQVAPAYTWEAQITFLSEPAVDWQAFRAGGAMYLGGLASPIGTESPPNPFSDINGSINIQLNDAGPVSTTHTVSFGPITLLTVTPGPAVPLKLVIFRGGGKTTTIVSAHFKVCDHVY